MKKWPVAFTFMLGYVSGMIAFNMEGYLYPLIIGFVGTFISCVVMIAFYE